MTLIEAARHFYFVLEAGVIPGDFDIAGSGTGLVAADNGGVLISTGTANGPVDVTVQVLQSRPDQVAAGWEEVAEASLSSSGGAFLLSNMDGEIGAEVAPPNGAGDYRLRVHARGRDEANRFVLPLEKVLEYHLLQLWPALPAPPSLIAGSDEFGEAFGRTLTPTGG